LAFAAFTDELLIGIDIVDAQHRSLFESLNTLSQAIQDGVTTVDIPRFLDEWFRRHVLSLDMEYAAYIRSEVPA
jgi:hemerythrin